MALCVTQPACRGGGPGPSRACIPRALPGARSDRGWRWPALGQRARGVVRGRVRQRGLPCESALVLHQRGRIDGARKVDEPAASTGPLGTAREPGGGPTAGARPLAARGAHPLARSRVAALPQAESKRARSPPSSALCSASATPCPCSLLDPLHVVLWESQHSCGPGQHIPVCPPAHVPSRAALWRSDVGFYTALMRASCMPADGRTHSLPAGLAWRNRQRPRLGRSHTASAHRTWRPLTYRNSSSRAVPSSGRQETSTSVRFISLSTCGSRDQAAAAGGSRVRRPGHTQERARACRGSSCTCQRS